MYHRGRGGHGDEILATTNDVTFWYGYNTPERQIYNPHFRVKPGRITVRHAKWAEQYSGRILVEPHIKGTFSAENKRWPYWHELVERSPLKLAQCAPSGRKLLEGVERIETPSFDHAVSVLSVARGIVTTDGGLHHAAGALGKPAVVIWGSYSDPKILGYDFHENIAEPDPDGLGWRHTHPACVAAMQRITVERVIEAMVRLWG